MASASKKFQSRQIPSAPGMFLRPASRVCQKIKPPISRICSSFFKILESSCFATKDNYCLRTLLISVHLQAVVAFTTNDRQVYHGFVYSVDFVQFLSGTNLVGGAFEDLSASDKIFQITTNHLHLQNVDDDRKQLIR